VVNPLTSPRTIVVEAEVAAPADGVALVATLPDGRRLPVQETGRTPAVLGAEDRAAADVERVLRRIHGHEVFGQKIHRYEVRPGRLTFWVSREPAPPGFDMLALRANCATRWPGTRAAGRCGPWRSSAARSWSRYRWRRRGARRSASSGNPPPDRSPPPGRCRGPPGPT